MEQEFQSWQRRSPVHRRAFERCTDIWQDAGGVTLSTYAAATDVSPERRVGRLVGTVGLAAVLTIAAVVMLRPGESASAFETGVGEQRTVVLADGSRMSLNTATRVRVDFSRTQRSIQVVDGEALFEVAKDAKRPFVVRAADSEVVATGTEFLVRTAPETQGHEKALTVTLIEGHVIVRDAQQGGKYPPAHPVAMVPGDRLHFPSSAGRAQPESSHPARLDRASMDAALAWKRGEVAFDNASLVGAVAEMNRYSTVPIIVGPSAAQSAAKISGVFRTGDNLGFARAVGRLQGLHFTGHVADATTGLTYMQQRYYDPIAGRFLSVDPVLTDANTGKMFGRYTYVENNPYAKVDPDGRESVGEMIDRNAIESAAAGNGGATFGWAFAGVAWQYLGAEGVSQIADKGSSVGRGDAVSAGFELAGVLPFGKILSPLARELSAAARAVEWTAHGGKHVAGSRLPWSKVVESTLSGPAKYLHGTNVESLERYVWEHGTQATNGRTWKVMAFGEEIGASNGKPSRWIRVEESGGTIHGHQISEAEFKKLTKE
jgi:transmembrane sensor